MTKDNLTKGFIKAKKDLQSFNLTLSLPKIMNKRKISHALIIELKTEEFSKITIYPVKKERIIKITLLGKDISDDILKKSMEMLQNYEIIHTSGLMVLNHQLIFECYLNLNFSEERSKDLKTSLDKIKNIFKKVKIEEINTI